MHHTEPWACNPALANEQRGHLVEGCPRFLFFGRSHPERKRAATARHRRFPPLHPGLAFLFFDISGKRQLLREKLLVFRIALSDAGYFSESPNLSEASAVPKSIQRATLFFLGIVLTSLTAVADEKTADDERRYLAALVEARDLNIDQIRQKMAESSGASKKSSTAKKASSSKKRQTKRSAGGNKTPSAEQLRSTLKQMREDLNRLKSGGNGARHPESLQPGAGLSRPARLEMPSVSDRGTVRHDGRLRIQ